MGKTVKMNRNQMKLPSLGCKARKTRLLRYWLFEEFLNPFITVRKRSCGKVMFLHLSVGHSVHRGGVYPSMHWADTRRVDTPPRPPLQRTVRILLECILVHTISYTLYSLTLWKKINLAKSTTVP